MLRYFLLALAAFPALCADWNPRLAADYLDSRQKEWFAWAPAQAPGGPCVSCHTGATYLLARPALRRALGENQPTLYETGLLDGLRARVDKTEAKDVFPSFAKEPLASQAIGVESIHAALFLHTDAAFARMWRLQKNGAWDWFSLDLDPYEMPESRFYGASLAALAAGSAPRNDRTAALASYLQREQNSQPLHNRLFLLWAAGKFPEALPKGPRQAILDEIWRSQEPDGGWTMESLGPWKAHAAAPPASGSNAYATALAAFAVQKAGVTRRNPKLIRALDWLKTHQDPQGYWDAASQNKRYEPGSQQIRFMRDAATAFAALALLEAGDAMQTAGARGVTTPRDALGFNIGDDYHIANYAQLETYWKKLATESGRLKLTDIGLTAEGRRQWMAVITSPENHRNLARYQQIAQRLARAEGLTGEQARALAREGKAVVWIDGGLHATETVGSQQLMELVHQMLSRNDTETMRFLNDAIILCVPANPDGQELVANWYMREKDPAKRSLANLPRLYQKYIGHDNNRDSLTSNMPETTNMNRQLFSEWNPQIMYNHHQSGPAGEIIFIPPFRDPVNHNVDSLVTLGIQAVGTAMHERLVAQGKGGSGMRTQAGYDGWWNGGMRNTTTYHNTIGILTEIVGSPNPMTIPLIPEKQLSISDLPLPVAPQAWHYRQSIDYSMETNRAILDYASRNREKLLYNIWRMGMNSIEKGGKDHWTITPKRVDALRKAAGAGAAPAALYEKVLHDPKFRDPRGYIIPSSQPDFPTATRFVNSLLKSGLTVLRATAAFQIAGKSYPAGSYVVKTAQAFRPMVRDMFEPQDHPHNAQYPGGPPIAPYDIAGWTLAMQMGVEYDRILEGFDGPFAKLNGLQEPPPGAIAGPAQPAGYLISHRTNNSFILTNRLLHAGAEVYWLKVSDRGPGTIWVPASTKALPVLQKGTRELGIAVQAQAAAPPGDSLKLKPIRVGLYDQYGGLMPSGWTRWLFEQFEFPFEVVYPQTLDAGNLRARFDVLVFPDGATRRTAGPAPETIPSEYRAWLGRITEEKTVPLIRQFLESGGSVVTVGGATSLAPLLGVPIQPAVSLPREKFYIPGSLMRAKIDNTNPLAYGMPSEVNVFFDESPVFKPLPAATAVAWFAGKETLTSGWAHGQEYLDGAVAVAEAKVGEGRVFIMGPEVTFRGEPHGTFKLMFNALYYGSAQPANLPQRR